MFRSYLVVALRHLWRHPGYSAINLLGLSLGMAAAILIGLYVRYELSYDRYHAHAERIFRITREHGGGRTNRTLHLAFVGPPFAAALTHDYPEIEQAVRFTRESGTGRYEDRLFHEERFYFADAGVFDVFTFPLRAGDPRTALADRSTVVITESTARRYFGAEDPVGKILTYNDQPFKVTGILQDVPPNSHFHFDFLASYATREATWGERVHTDDAWQWSNAATYLLLRDADLVDQLRRKLPGFLAHHTSDNRIKFQTLHLQALTDIHLYSHLDEELEANGDIRTVRLFMAIAFLILFIACINFINLSTARSAHRVLEVGIRKALGGHRVQIMRQFLGESLIQAGLALVIALFIVALVLPAYNNLTNKQLALSFSDHGRTIASLIALVVIIGTLAGAYPAFFFMRVRPVALLGKRPHAGATPAGLRKMLVAVQFGISTLLIVGTMTVRRQLSYINDQAFKVDKDLIVVLPANDASKKKYDVLKRTLRQHPDIINAAGSWDTPGHRFNTVMGPVKAEVNGELVILRPGPKFFIIDPDFLPTYDLTLVAGRNFSPEFGTDATEAFIINESTVGSAGWSSPQEAVGKAFRYANRSGRIVGVVEDFHLESLHHAITPLVMYIKPEWIGQFSIKIRSGHVPGALRFIERTWKRLLPGQPFQYAFLEDQFDRQYLAEQRMEQGLGIFALLGIGIACLGLFGLTAFIAERRTREIAIRKILGATVPTIMQHLSTGFLSPIVVANIIAWPVAYVFMSAWLKNFSYRIEIEAGAFVLSGILTFGIALVTMSYHTIKAAMANPADSLRYE